jgi:hypothetical protein
LRQLEIGLLKELHAERQLELDVALLSKIDVDQFYGIEIGEFPARIAEVALWMMDHIMNSRLSLEFGESYVRIPLRKSPHIHDKDALEIDWQTVLPSAECSYVFGNPPFGGSKYQTTEQREQVRRVARLPGSGGTLDYVASWFLKAGAYIRQGPVHIGFVATNSITQGEQVAQIWPLLFDRCGLEIAFAHRTFAWGSDARGMAHVHVVIVGLTARKHEPDVKRLFTYDDIRGDPTESHHSALTAYLFDAGTVTNRHLVVEERSRPLCNVPPLISGTQPIDDGNYIFDLTERTEFLRVEPAATPYLRPYVGSEEFINGGNRWILSLQDATPTNLRSMPEVIRRMRSVREFRHKSKRRSTLEIADSPERYNVEVIPDRPFLVIPKVSSERRDYIPIGWLGPPTIPSDLVFILEDAELWHFAALTSRMHMAWLRHIGGRLESRYRYSIGVVYNTFPWPEMTEPERQHLGELAQAVLDARAEFPNATLADQYDSDVMKPNLRRAHRALDLAVDRLYRPQAFDSDLERVEHLFGRYEKLIAPLTTLPPVRRQARRRTRVPS